MQVEWLRLGADGAAAERRHRVVGAVDEPLEELGAREQLDEHVQPLEEDERLQP